MKFFLCYTLSENEWKPLLSRATLVVKALLVRGDSMGLPYLDED